MALSGARTGVLDVFRDAQQGARIDAEEVASHQDQQNRANAESASAADADATTATVFDAVAFSFVIKLHMFGY